MLKSLSYNNILCRRINRMISCFSILICLNAIRFPINRSIFLLSRNKWIIWYPPWAKESPALTINDQLSNIIGSSFQELLIEYSFFIKFMKMRKHLLDILIHRSIVCLIAFHDPLLWISVVRRKIKIQ